MAASIARPRRVDDGGDRQRARNAGQVYITDDVMVNPWDTLPSYWDAQVDRIEEINDNVFAAPGDHRQGGKHHDAHEEAGQFGRRFNRVING